jgi:hypothetical protein
MAGTPPHERSRRPHQLMLQRRQRTLPTMLIGHMTRCWARDIVVIHGPAPQPSAGPGRFEGQYWKHSSDDCRGHRHVLVAPSPQHVMLQQGRSRCRAKCPQHPDAHQSGRKVTTCQGLPAAVVQQCVEPVCRRSAVLNNRLIARIPHMCRLHNQVQQFWVPLPSAFLGVAGWNALLNPAEGHAHMKECKASPCWPSIAPMPDHKLNWDAPFQPVQVLSAIGEGQLQQTQRWTKPVGATADCEHTVTAI